MVIKQLHTYDICSVSTFTVSLLVGLELVASGHSESTETAESTETGPNCPATFIHMQSSSYEF